MAVTLDLSVRVIQIQQTPSVVDIMFVYRMPILLGLLTPLALIQVHDLKDDRGTDGLKKFLSVAKGRRFDTKCIRTGAIASLAVDLERDHGLTIEATGSGTHVEEIERMCQTLKKRIRCQIHDLPFVICKTLLQKNVIFCARGINMVASRTSLDKVSPLEQFTGRKIDAKVDLRISFGDYVQAINPMKDNQVENANTHSCIAMRHTGSLTGSVQMLWRLETQSFVIRDQFTVLPIPDEVINRENASNHRGTCTEYAIKMSVRAAMRRDRPKEALPVIEAELQQMHDKRV
jgi:hypothetical protein